MSSIQTHAEAYENQPFSASEKTYFIRNTYLHVALSIGIFAILTALLVNSPFGKIFTVFTLSNQFVWLGVLFLFAGISWVADKWARSDTSKTLQYLGLGLYIVLESIIFTPMLFIANAVAPGAISIAGFLTLFLFAGLTAVAFLSGKDFSFLRGFLSLGFFIVAGIILASAIFGPLTSTLSLILSGGMILFAGAAILYDTSNIIRYYRPDQYVAAALSLFASVALLFWYILQFILNFSSRK